jgi:hypothetical protein
LQRNCHRTSQADWLLFLARRILRHGKINNATLQQRVFAIIRREKALALTDKRVFGKLLPFGFARQSERAIG